MQEEIRELKQQLEARAVTESMAPLPINLDFLYEAEDTSSPRTATTEILSKELAHSCAREAQVSCPKTLYYHAARCLGRSCYHKLLWHLIYNISERCVVQGVLHLLDCTASVLWWPVDTFCIVFAM